MSLKKFLPFLFTCLISVSLLAGNNSTGWSSSDICPKRFIENKSQFDGRDKLEGSKILFGVDQNGTQVYFTTKGLAYRFDALEPKNESKEEMEREHEREGKMTKDEW